MLTAIDMAIGGPDNSVQGSYFNSDLSGTKVPSIPFSDGNYVNLIDATNTTIGGTKAGAGNVILAYVNLDSSSGGTGTTGTVIQGNNIGVDSTGSVGFAGYRRRRL